MLNFMSDWYYGSRSLFRANFSLTCRLMRYHFSLPRRLMHYRESLPGVYRQCDKVYTDYWDAYVTVVPSKRHEAVGTESGLTRYIECLNNPFCESRHLACERTV
jgi:hypothetical protein